MTRVRTRFAPSPTGSLHVGNARIAVLNWLVARHHGGEFVLRIEDTDPGRNVSGAASAVLDDLSWLGLDWDEGPTPEGERGPHAPYRQSERAPLYTAAAHRLLASGAAYRCFCTPEALDAARARALDAGRSPGYPGTCRALSPDEARTRAEAGEPHAVRLATPDRGRIPVDDVIRGRVTFDAAEIGDFVILRSDGVPTYNFAVVVDDAAMAITHVIRGAGHLSNTPHQILVYGALGAAPPVFAHAPTVLGPDRRKLSKRTGARPLEALRREGLHPDAVVNYLSLLGWSSPSGDEVLSRERLVREISLERVNAGDVVFDPDKLRWLSARHIETMPLDALAEATRPWVEASEYRPLLDGPYRDALAAIRNRIAAFGEVADHLRPFAGPTPAQDWRPDPTQRQVLASVRAALDAVEAWEDEPLEAAIRKGGRVAGAKARDLYLPLRLALTGEEHGPRLAPVLRIQGREPVLRALDAALSAPRPASAGDV